MKTFGTLRELGAMLTVAASMLLAGCSSPSFTPASASSNAAPSALLAPTGRLRMGLYPGTPTGYLVDPDGSNARGVGYVLGAGLAARLGVPFEPVILPNNDAVLEAVAQGKVDLAFTHVTPPRMKLMDFSAPCLDIELGYLVRPGFQVTSIDNLDRAGVHIGVTAKSSSDAEMTGRLQHATLVRAPTILNGAEQLRSGSIDAYTTNKPTLFEMGDSVPGSRVLPEQTGVEELALALPHGRLAGMPFIRQYLDEANRSGKIDQAIQAAGLRGALPSPAHGATPASK